MAAGGYNKKVSLDNLIFTPLGAAGGQPRHSGYRANKDDNHGIQESTEELTTISP